LNNDDKNGITVHGYFLQEPLAAAISVLCISAALAMEQIEQQMSAGNASMQRLPCGMSRAWAARRMQGA